MNFKIIQDLLGDFLIKIPFNFLDYFLLGFLIIFIYEEILEGLVFSFLNFSSIIISFFSALFFYGKISAFLIQVMSIVKGLSDAFVFLFLGAAVYFLFGVLFNSFISAEKIYLPKVFNFLGGIFFGFFSFVLLSAFFLSFILSLPFSPLVKNIVKNSFFASIILTRLDSVEIDVKTIFGGVSDNLLNFLTVEPSSSQTLKLNFSINSPAIDINSEQVMFNLVNNERTNFNLSVLNRDENLTQAARAHAQDMLMHGYFSHYGLSGLSPFDRLEKANVNYSYAAENLAFAPSAQLAMNGLMKSPGHRANILNPAFRKIGIGVADGGIYGRMFVQEFTN